MSYSECLPDDVECQQNVAYLSKTDQDCVNSGKTGNPAIDSVTNPLGQWFCVQGKGATKATGGQNILGGMGQNGMIVLVIIAVVIFMIMR